MAEVKTIKIDVDTKQAVNAMENLSKATNDVNKSFEEVYGDLQPLTTRMGEAEDRLYELANAGQTATQEYQDLLEDDSRAMAFLATLMPDGSPQVTPVWFNTDGELLLINSAKGRVKDRNMRHRPQVAVTLMAMGDPYRYVQIRGEVVEIDELNGADHINTLSMKYRGRRFDLPAGQTRVIYKIKPYE